MVPELASDRVQLQAPSPYTPLPPSLTILKLYITKLKMSSIRDIYRTKRFNILASVHSIMPITSLHRPLQLLNTLFVVYIVLETKQNKQYAGSMKSILIFNEQCSGPLQRCIVPAPCLPPTPGC